MVEYGKYTPDFDSEDAVQEWLEESFEACGWTAIREVSPHGSNKRADLIVHNEEYGWVGVEVKYLESSDCGGAIGDAIQQVFNKYHGRKYIGNKIDVWALAPYYRVEHMGHHGDEYRMQRVVNSFNLGYLSLGDKRLMLEFRDSGEPWRVPVGNVPQAPDGYTSACVAYSEYGDYEKIKSELGSCPINR